MVTRAFLNSKPFPRLAYANLIKKSDVKCKCKIHKRDRIRCYSAVILLRHCGRRQIKIERVRTKPSTMVSLNSLGNMKAVMRTFILTYGFRYFCAWGTIKQHFEICCTCGSIARFPIILSICTSIIIFFYIQTLEPTWVISYKQMIWVK